MSLVLSQGLQEKLINAPEVSYGVNEITVILKNGKQYRHVLVAWGREVIKVDGSENIPFTSDEIQTIEICE